MPQPKRPDYRNRSFKNKDLTGADFSGADIRGCNFSGATLTNANFQRVRTGRSRKQSIIQFAGGVAGAAAGATIGCAMGALLGAIVGSAAGGIANSGDTVNQALSNTGMAIGAIAGAGAGAVAGAGAGAIAVAVAVVISIAVPIAIPALLALHKHKFTEMIVWSGALVFLVGFAIYLLRKLIKTTRDSPGTVFKCSDLTNVNFSHARIRNADFLGATLNFVNWTDASFARCRFPDFFNHSEIMQLCISRDGNRQNYNHSNLKNLHLVGVTLTGANLARTNLNDANLQSANLEDTNLQSAQALGTDFSNAVLTGAYIQHWGINAATRFTDVHCDYIYLESDRQERRPASGIFQPGDFEKLVNHFTNTLDFLFRNGIEAQAFDVALKNLLTEYENAGLSLQAIVHVGDGDRLVKLNVANPNADYAPMHAQFTHDYASMQKQLEAARETAQALQQNLANAEGQLTVYREQSVFLQGFVYHQTDRFSRPSFNAPNAQFTGDPMSDKRNEIRFGNVQGDVSGIAGGDISGVAGKDITGAAGGDISGTLTLTIGQLEASKAPEALRLADLLKQLKAAIEKPDAGLDKKDQEKALKHLDAIAKLGNDPKNADLLEKAGDALDALPTIIKRGNGLMEFAEKYLPTITAGIRAVLATGGIAL